MRNAPTNTFAAVVAAAALVAAVAASPARGQTPGNTVHEETYATVGYDNGRQHGIAAHGFFGRADMPAGELPLRVFAGGAFHTKSGNTRIYAGAGPGVRVDAAENVQVAAYMMFGIRNENRGAEKTVFRTRAGGGVDYRFGETTAFHAGIAYDKSFHLLAGITARF